MKTFNILAVGMVLAVLVTSCKKDVGCEKGNGKTTSEVRQISGFTGVESTISANVFLEEAPNFEVKIVTDENLLDNIKTTVSNGILRIDTQNGDCIRPQGTVNVYVKAPKFSLLSISGSGDMIGKRLSGNDLNLSISGSGDMQLDSLTFSSVEAKISGSGDIRLSAAALTGLFDANINGSGDLDAYAFPTTQVVIKISGSGNAIVYPMERLDATISGSGDIRYLGNPGVLNTTVSGSGTIKPY